MSDNEGRDFGVGGFSNEQGYFTQTPSHWDHWPLYNNAAEAYKLREFEEEQVKPNSIVLESEPELLDKALEDATLRYAGLYRKTSERVPVALPYVVHPIDVMRRVSEFGVKDANVIVGALFHDLLEDTDTDPDWLRKEYGDVVFRIVSDLTYDETKYVDKAAYLEDVCEARIDSLVIKLADRASNVESFAAGRPDYVTKYARKGIPLYRAVIARRQELYEWFGQDACSSIINLASELLYKY